VLKQFLVKTLSKIVATDFTDEIDKKFAVKICSSKNFVD